LEHARHDDRDARALGEIDRLYATHSWFREVETPVSPSLPTATTPEMSTAPLISTFFVGPGDVSQTATRSPTQDLKEALISIGFDFTGHALDVLAGFSPDQARAFAGVLEPFRGNPPTAPQALRALWREATRESPTLLDLVTVSESGQLRVASARADATERVVSSLQPSSGATLDVVELGPPTYTWAATPIVPPARGVYEMLRDFMVPQSEEPMGSLLGPAWLGTRITMSGLGRFFSWPALPWPTCSDVALVTRLWNEAVQAMAKIPSEDMNDRARTDGLAFWLFDVSAYVPNTLSRAGTLLARPNLSLRGHLNALGTGLRNLTSASRTWAQLRQDWTERAILLATPESLVSPAVASDLIDLIETQGATFGMASFDYDRTRALRIEQLRETFTVPEDAAKAIDAWAGDEHPWIKRFGKS
jgi:hypothetical protein